MAGDLSASAEDPAAASGGGGAAEEDKTAGPVMKEPAEGAEEPADVPDSDDTRGKDSPHRTASATVLDHSAKATTRTKETEGDSEPPPPPETGEQSNILDENREEAEIFPQDPPDDPPFANLSLSASRAPSSAENVILPPSIASAQKSYDYLLKVLLVGDSDVGKQEILSGLEDGTTESPFCSSSAGAAFKQTIILIDGKRVKLQLWDTSGQGRFCTIIRSYSRGAQGILLVYDITNKWSFEGINRWLKEVDQHAPGIPKVLVGNRLHLAFKREVDQTEAEVYAEKNSMGFFEVSPLVNFNISESFVEVARMALKRNGMERLWRSNRVSSLYELCAHTIVNRTTVYGIDHLPLPESVKQNLKSYSMTSYSTLRRPGGSGNGSKLYKSVKHRKSFGKRRSLPQASTYSPRTPSEAAGPRCGGGSKKSCSIA